MAASEPFDPNRRQSVHIPKLKFRQSTYDAGSVETANTISTGPSIPSLSTSSTPSEYCPSPRYPPSDASFPPWPSYQSSLAPPQPEKKTKKRQNFFTSLFAKEPSSQALVAYERQLKEQGALKDGKLKAVGMPMVSSTKLPPNVPKVNSKWDGIPSALKQQEKKDVAAQERVNLWNDSTISGLSGHSSSSNSLRTSSRRPQSKGTLGGASVRSAYSGEGKNQLADLYGWEFPGSASSLEIGSRPDTRRSSIRSVPMQVPNFATEPSQPPEIPREYFDRPVLSRGGSSITPAYSHSPSFTPNDLSPRTPSAPMPIHMHDGSGSSEKTLYDPQAQIADDIRTTTLDIPPANEAILRSRGPNVLGPPAAARRKLKSPGVEAEKNEPASILKKRSVPTFRAPRQDQLLPNSAFLPSPRSPAIEGYPPPPRRRMSAGLDKKVSPWDEPMGSKTECFSDRADTPTSMGGLMRLKGRRGLLKKQ
ncbi:uncharacterized protein KY384_004080 [Bacidia gigantensis]|uniref:uncharacterized protein n=1 Tax=Bacidia gigantensis TaxID=2732470 RepID=UPI001D03C6C9|nr:uncharacterized protein KY384_004080 [Bacidia gigantensis]KAG8530723.1 hypothetical protein KY384_004080 [Bacidia gigantensis]